jgi:biotin operon repressor
MISPARFDRLHGKGAIVRLRSMLDDPTVTYERIAKNLGLTKQRIAKLAKELGINGRQRQRERTLSGGPHVIKQFKKYPPAIQAVVDKLRRAGLQVAPYNSPQPSFPNRVRTSLKMILVNGALCTIQVRPAFKFRPNGREYARLDVGRDIRKAKVALFAIRGGRTMKLYIIPTSHLRNVTASGYNYGCPTLFKIHVTYESKVRRETCLLTVEHNAESLQRSF